jgi:hypothetical protein
LYRATPSAKRVTESELASAERAIIKTMREEGLGKRMTDGELLMVLQHHAIPTRLIDFCRSILPALFFATEGGDGRDGRLFVIGQRVDPGTKMYPFLLLSDGNRVPWDQVASGTAWERDQWSNSVAVVDDGALDPRMRAQSGCFLVGGLPKRQAGDSMMINGVDQPIARWADITTLRIYFPGRGAKKHTSARWPAVGWTVRIPADWKAPIRIRLAKRGFDVDHMYPDFDGCRRLGERVARHPERFR